MTKEDLKQINQLLDRQTDGIARLFRDTLQMIEGWFEGIENTLAQHTGMHNNHTNRLDRIEPPVDR